MSLGYAPAVLPHLTSDGHDEGHTPVLLGLFELAHSVRIYFHPLIGVSGSLSDSYANALVAEYLHLDRFEPS